MRKPSIVLTVIAIALASVSVSLSAEKLKVVPVQEKSSVWMQKKLEFSQNILAGLTEGDFEKIGRNAQNMNFVGHLEKWERATTPEYKRQISYFELANRELIRQAKDKNIDGAILVYNQLAISCVQCHKVVRDTK